MSALAYVLPYIFILVVFLLAYIVGIKTKGNDSLFDRLYRRFGFGRLVALFGIVVVFVAFSPTSEAQGIPTVDAAGYSQWAAQTAIQDAMNQTQSQILNEVYKKALGNSALGSATPVMNQQMQILLYEAGGSALGAGSAAIKQKMLDSFGDGQNVSSKASPQQQNAAVNSAAKTMSMNAARQLDDMNTESARIDNLASQSKAATGQLEVIQAGNEINLELLRQNQLMRQQQLVRDQAEATRTADAAAQRLQNAAATKKLFGIKE